MPTQEILQAILEFNYNHHHNLLIELELVRKQRQWLTRVLSVPLPPLYSSSQQRILQYLYRIVLNRDFTILQELVNVTSLIRDLRILLRTRTIQ